MVIAAIKLSDNYLLKLGWKIVCNNIFQFGSSKASCYERKTDRTEDKTLLSADFFMTIGTKSSLERQKENGL